MRFYVSTPISCRDNNCVCSFTFIRKFWSNRFPKLFVNGYVFNVNVVKVLSFTFMLKIDTNIALFLIVVKVICYFI